METIEQINSADARTLWKIHKGFEVITNKHIYRFFMINKGKLDNYFDISCGYSNLDYQLGAELKHIKITNMRGGPARMQKSRFTLGSKHKWHTDTVRSVTLNTDRDRVSFYAVNEDGTAGLRLIVTCENRRSDK